MAKIISTKVSENDDHRQPTIVAVVGMPGSGKTTSSDILASLLQDTYNTSCIVLPMDGYHFPIAHLKAMHNPEDVIYRRGAPDTFDAKALRNILHKIRNGSEKIAPVPGFDHTIGDPTPDKHIFNRNKHTVVIVEGLYLLYEDESLGWNGIKVKC